MTTAHEINRTTRLTIDADRLATMQETVGMDAWRDAYAYLSLWAAQKHHHCHIYADGATDMVAVYRTNESDPSAAYVIGAVWHGDHYGFHS